MRKHCGNCAVYDRKDMKHSELCGKCVTEHFPNGKESDPSMWKPLPQTNADRIRSMSDEELAKLFTQTVADGCPPDMDWTCKKDEKGWDACDSCWLKWLQQPVEEGKHE